MMAKETPLTFEQFTSAPRGIPLNDNFPIHFWRGAMADYYRTLPYYQRLCEVTPDLEQRLRQGISSINAINIKNMAPFNKDLYLAYRVMRRYVTSDTKLGIPS